MEHGGVFYLLTRESVPHGAFGALLGSCASTVRGETQPRIAGTSARGWGLQWEGEPSQVRVRPSGSPAPPPPLALSPTRCAARRSARGWCAGCPRRSRRGHGASPRVHKSLPKDQGGQRAEHAAPLKGGPASQSTSSLQTLYPDFVFSLPGRGEPLASRCAIWARGRRACSSGSGF